MHRDHLESGMAHCQSLLTQTNISLWEPRKKCNFLKEVPTDMLCTPIPIDLLTLNLKHNTVQFSKYFPPKPAMIIPGSPISYSIITSISDYLEILRWIYSAFKPLLFYFKLNRHSAII